MLIPQAAGGALLSGGVPGPRRGKYLRRETREACVLEFSQRIPKLAAMADGRVRVMLGYTEPWQAAEQFFELRERMANPDADRVRVWGDAPIEERKLLTEVFHIMLGNGKTKMELALDVGVATQLQAADLLARYGLGTQIQAVDDEGETLRGVIVLPELSMHMVQTQQAAMRARMKGDTIDADFEIVEEEAEAGYRRDDDEAPPPIEERINPELVEVMRRRRQHSNGNGNGKEKGTNSG